MGLPGSFLGLLWASWGSLLKASRKPGKKMKKNTYLKIIGFGMQKLVYVKRLKVILHSVIKKEKTPFGVAK